MQHREVQGHESKKFLSYFPKGIQYLAGGVETGFKHVDRDKFDTRLLHVKGRRNVRVSQVSNKKASPFKLLEQYLVDFCKECSGTLWLCVSETV